MPLIKLVIALVLSLTLVLGALPTQAVAAKGGLEDQVLQIIRDHPEVILESVEQYQKEQQAKVQQRQRELLATIATEPENFIGSSPVQGVVDSGVLLIEFSDFQCPYCGAVHKTLKTFVQDHADQVTLVYKHYPLAQVHAEAMSAATAAWAAQQQDKFWQYQDFLFTHQDDLGEDLYSKAAKKLKLDRVQFDRDRTSETARAAIKQDMALAERLGISGTPFFVMGNETFSGTVETSFLEEKLSKLAEPT